MPKPELVLFCHHWRGFFSLANLSHSLLPVHADVTGYLVLFTWLFQKHCCFCALCFRKFGEWRSGQETDGQLPGVRWRDQLSERGGGCRQVMNLLSRKLGHPVPWHLLCSCWVWRIPNLFDCYVVTPDHSNWGSAKAARVAHSCSSPSHSLGFWSWTVITF